MSKINIDKILNSFPARENTSAEATDPGFRPAGFFSRWRDLKEAREILSKIERIPSAPMDAARRFFDVDAARLADLGRRHPKEITKLLRKSFEKSPHPEETALWFHLVEASQGDHKNLLDAFEKADLKTRLALFRITLFSTQTGDGRLVRELFVKLMESTTPKEKEEWVEPTLHCILNRAVWNRDPRVQNKRAWLIALYHGWRKESQELA